MKNIYEGYDPYEDIDAMDLFIDHVFDEYDQWLMEQGFIDNRLFRHDFCMLHRRFEAYAQTIQEERGCE